MSIKILVTVLFINCFTFSVICEQFKYNGFTVLRITPQTKQQLDYLKELSENNFELDFWTYPSLLNNTVDIMIPPHLKESIGNVFRQKYFTFETTISDVENLFEAQRTKVRADAGFWDDYQDLSKILEFCDNLVAQNPLIASKQTIGKSFQNRDIVLMKISLGGSPRPVIFMDANIHAREWITSAVTTFIINELVDKYNSNDPDVTSLLNKYDFYFIPVLNPDGFVWCHESERLWRKTRSPNSGSTCIGTDPNRNFNHNWTVVGTSYDPCSNNYHGRAPFAEPETKAVSDYILSLPKERALYIAMHSCSQVLISPWGYTSALPPNNADLERVSAVFTEAIKNPYNTIYRSGTQTSLMYPASGTGCDWAYAIGNFTFAFTAELRDTGTYCHALPPDQIMPSSIETWNAFLAMWLSL